LFAYRSHFHLSHSDIVLTAAHCLDGYDFRAYINASNYADLSTSISTFGIDALIHSDYASSVNTQRVNDIGLLRLDQTIYSIDFPEINTDITIPQDGQLLQVIGHGQLHEDQFEPLYADELQVVTVASIPMGTCTAQYKDLTIVSSQHHICTAMEGKSPCAGDSGGPLILERSGLSDVIVGIVSFAAGCARAEYSNVYTRVSTYVDWVSNGICQLSADTPDYCITSQSPVTAAPNPSLSPVALPAPITDPVLPLEKTVAPYIPTTMAPVQNPETSAPSRIPTRTPTASKSPFFSQIIIPVSRTPAPTQAPKSDNPTSKATRTPIQPVIVPTTSAPESVEAPQEKGKTPAPTQRSLKTPVPIAISSTPVPIGDSETPAPIAMPETPAPVLDFETPAPIVSSETSAPVSAPQTSAPVSAPQTPAPVSASQTSEPVSTPQTLAPVSAPQTSTPVSTPQTLAPVEVADTPVPVELVPETPAPNRPIGTPMPQSSKLPISRPSNKPEITTKPSPQEPSSTPEAKPTYTPLATLGPGGLPMAAKYSMSFQLHDSLHYWMYGFSIFYWTLIT
jgi:Trypsin